MSADPAWGVVTREVPGILPVIVGEAFVPLGDAEPAALLGIGIAGATLIRPDGIVA